MQFCQLMQKKQAKTSVCRLLCDFYPLFRLKKAVSLMMQDDAAETDQWIISYFLNTFSIASIERVTCSFV